MSIKVLNNSLIIFNVRSYPDHEMKNYIKEEGKSYESDIVDCNIVPLRHRDHILHDLIMSLSYFKENFLSLEPVVEDINGYLTIVDASNIFFKNGNSIEVEHSIKDVLILLNGYYIR
jgi:hypothetical protein